MSQNTPAAGYYSGPGGSSTAPSTSPNYWKLADPLNIVGGGNKGMAQPSDFGQAAAATSAGSQQAVAQQTQANRPNQVTGFGSSTWAEGPNGQWTQTVGLNPALGGTLGNLQSTALDNSQHGAESIANDRNQAITSNYNQAVSRLNPQWQMRDEQTQTQLANEGLDPNSAAYRNAMLQEGQARNDAYSSAMANAIGLGNQTEGVDLQAQMAPYQQMGALQGYENNLPGFHAAMGYQPADYLQAAEAAAGMLGQANSANSSQNAGLMSGLGAFLAAMM